MSNPARRLPSIALGRLPDLCGRPDADRIAYKVAGWDAVPYAFQSRKAMLAFCKVDGPMRALIKDRVESCMLVNRNTQEVA